MDAITLFVALAYVLAGTVKGTVGLGLPPITMGLLALVMPPVQAAALLILPSFLTNLWQMLSGGHLIRLVRRLWPVMLAIVAGTLAGVGWLDEENARVGTRILGVVLVLYALSSLYALHLVVAPHRERLLGPVAGGVTGLITAATGTWSIPVVPYFQAIGLEKDELVQAMGLSFTVSTVALTINLLVVGAFSAELAPDVGVAVVAAFAGMWAGQRLRRALDPATFRRWFLWALLALGAYLVARSFL